MIDNAEETELVRALATIEKMRAENDALQTELESVESERDELRSEVASAEHDLGVAHSENEDLMAANADLQTEVDSVHEGIGMRSIIERAWLASPIATENDLQRAGLGHACSVLRTDHQTGLLNFSVKQ